jgi:hypothetical protein
MRHLVCSSLWKMIGLPMAYLMTWDDDASSASY